AVNPEFRAIVTRPDDHFIAGPYSRVKLSSRGCARHGGGHPTIGERIVSPAGVEEANIVINSAPDNHFVASPDCAVSISAGRGVGHAGGCPTIGVRILSPATVEIGIAAPDDH